MPTEIERKFLVDPNLWEEQEKEAGVPCEQAYLHSDLQKTIRVRILGDKGLLTIKGKTTGISRAEYEYEIPLEDAREMMASLGDQGIQKIRHYIAFEGKTWEVDVFHGANEGLLLAELELSSEDESFSKPPWLGEEVSLDKRYFNSYLAQHPYPTWKPEQ